SSTKGKSATNTTAAEQSPNTTAAKQSPNATVQTTGEGIQKIQHIVMIMQENHSFDQYFGTYPGADGIPMKDGEPTVCVPDPKAGTCQKPYHDTDDVNRGGPHGKDAVIKDVNDGKMDGFIAAAQQSGDARCANDPNLPDCVRVGEIDVMGYHTRDELGNYWTYADNYVLHDHMFEPIASWSLPSHLMMVSGWSAKCKIPNDPTSCINEPDNPNSITDGARPPAKPQKRPHYAWTDITYLLHQNHVSWNYYIAEGTQPDCDDDQPTCQAK